MPLFLVLLHYRWYHFAVTYDGTIARLYVNGQQEAFVNAVGKLSWGLHSCVQISELPQYFIGDLDEVALYDHAITQTDIARRHDYRWKPIPDCQGGSTYSNAVCASSSVGYWRLGELSGPVASDTANLRDGTYAGTITFGKLGVSHDADTAIGLAGGGNMDVSYEPYGTYAFDTASAEGWLKTTTATTATPRGVVGKSGSFQLGLASNKANATITVGGTTYTLAGTSVLNDGNWHHVALTFDGTTFKLYVDGLTEGELAVTGSLAKTVNPIRVGILPQYFIGDLDEVAIYDRALPQDDIIQHYALGN